MLLITNETNFFRFDNVDGSFPVGLLLSCRKKYCKLLRLPNDGDSDPVNELLFKAKYVRVVKPRYSGIGPVKWLLLMFTVTIVFPTVFSVPLNPTALPLKPLNARLQYLRLNSFENTPFGNIPSNKLLSTPIEISCVRLRIELGKLPVNKLSDKKT